MDAVIQTKLETGALLDFKYLCLWSSGLVQYLQMAAMYAREPDWHTRTPLWQLLS